jgi:hypothetical protein
VSEEYEKMKKSNKHIRHHERGFFPIPSGFEKCQALAEN